jgi:hypothetical protein
MVLHRLFPLFTAWQLNSFGLRTPPLPWERVRGFSPLLTPFCMYGLRVAHVKSKTLDAFFGLSRLFTHNNPHIPNDCRDEIYYLLPFDFWFEKTCHSRELLKIYFLLSYVFECTIFMLENWCNFFTSKFWKRPQNFKILYFLKSQVPSPRGKLDFLNARKWHEKVIIDRWWFVYLGNGHNFVTYQSGHRNSNSGKCCPDQKVYKL